MGLPAIKLSSQLQIDRKDMGRADSLRFNVLTFVVEENYERAIQELKKFRDGDSEYPQFRERVERYIAHAVDLVNAIRAKRKFPGMSSLTMAKQQEINERFSQHFQELQYVLKRVEKIHQELRLEDARSTVLVVQSIVNSVFVIAIVAFALDVTGGLFNTAVFVVDDFLNTIVKYIF